MLNPLQRAATNLQQRQLGKPHLYMSATNESRVLQFPIYVFTGDGIKPDLACGTEDQIWSLHLYRMKEGMEQDAADMLVGFCSAAELIPLVEQASRMGAVDVLYGLHLSEDDPSAVDGPVWDAQWSETVESFLARLNERRMHEEQFANN